MANRFVQQNPRPSRAEYDFHVTSWSFASVELKNCLTRRFFCEMFGIFLAEEEVQRDAAAAAGSAAA